MQVTEREDSKVGGICCRNVLKFLGEKRLSKIILTSFKCACSRVLAE